MCVCVSVCLSPVLMWNLIISIQKFVWSGMVLYGPLGSPMVLYGPIYGLVWARMVLYRQYDPILSKMVPYGPIWSPRVPYGPIRPHIWTPKVQYGSLGSLMIRYVTIWFSMVPLGLVWSTMTPMVRIVIYGPV